MDQLNDKMKSLQVSKSECEAINSKAIVKYSSVLRPANFAHLQCNTDLNLPPSNWLSSAAESYGLRHVPSHSDGFSSFQMAHMFPDCIGEVDVISDAENIKRLLKIPYSNKSVSMMIHRIENTLLIDEFDVHKYLLVKTEDDWEWLRKFFFKNILESLEMKEKCITHKINTFDVIQQRSLNSKFLHYSIADSSNSNCDSQLPIKILPKPSSTSIPPLPEPTPEEEFPDDPKTHRLFNQNVLWNFEDLQMLLGTDMPIFGGGTHPCLSLRLRDMSKPISVLTGIDYWLDNLMCNVPEVVMCYHLNGIVQKYELIKTEDLPYLNDSKFSPKVIRDVAQNILSFLKSNATKAGHTYWLFKGKYEDVVKLYDLTSLCSESLVEGRCEGQNPFTIPVAMLLYRVARNLKNNPVDGQPSSPATIQILLNNCLNLLNKTKYPQIVTSVNYMLSDLYIPVNTNPTSPKLEDLVNKEEENNLTSPDITDDESPDLNEMQPTYSVDVRDLCLSYKKENKAKQSEHSSQPVVQTVEERCKKSLYHVGSGLSCLQYFKTLRQQEHNVNVMNDEPFMAGTSDAIPMPYNSTTIENKPKKEDKVISKTSKNKNRKRNKGNSILNNDDDIDTCDVPGALLCKSISETMPTWHNPPDAKDSESWKKHLKVLLYEKACLSYATLAEHDFICEKYGYALKHFRLVFECRLCIVNTNVNELVVYLLGRCGDCCLMIAQNWNKVKQYTLELEEDEEYDKEIRNTLQDECAVSTRDDFNLIPSIFQSKENMLDAAAKCYTRSLEMETNDKNKNNLNRRIGNVYNEITYCYINEIAIALQEEVELPLSRLQWLLHQSENYLSMGINKFESSDDHINLALLYSNMGRLFRHVAYYSSLYTNSYGDLVKNKDFTNQAVESYTKALAVLGNRRYNPQLWDMVSWDLSTTVYNLAIQSQDDPSMYEDRTEAEKEVISLLLKALKYCDLENDSSRRLLYEFRAAYIHDRLASLYHNRLRCLEVDATKFKTTLHQCTSHYNKAFDMFIKMDRPLECLEILIKTIALDELQMDNATNTSTKVKFIVSISQTLGKCCFVLNMLLENYDEQKDFKPINTDDICKNKENIDDDKDTKLKTKKLLTLLEERLQHILKNMIRLAMGKVSKLANKIDELKSIYNELLRKSSDAKGYHYLLTVITRINELKL
ncbi:erythroid differentiation-related factor 1 isoform X2 [Daktulosphaira vitifoliae]|uniref:erythroid differentiation-related factor 1 isoform X2 n=1 Tax=Daktulosphaira vitifoliae TaxID=58002 RepID=UPI0021A97CED|nr:erythroid differentiation-related factor 1 isoform X2 [Daktulosphaira vitifoliae]